jgi:hypothetical protein
VTNFFGEMKKYVENHGIQLYFANTPTPAQDPAKYVERLGLVVNNNGYLFDNIKVPHRLIMCVWTANSGIVPTSTLRSQSHRQFGSPFFLRVRQKLRFSNIYGLWSTARANKQRSSTFCHLLDCGLRMHS